MSIETIIPDETAMLRHGREFSTQIKQGMRVYLHGELGAGKTTWVRGLLRGLGYEGIVKSPTYTLVETYCLANMNVHHFDLYRLKDPLELEYLGIADYFTDDALVLVEWPEKGASMLPPSEIDLQIDYVENQNARRLTVNFMRSGV